MRSDWLDSFLVFSESMNFTRAAEVLHISQPALHVKVGKLSEWLGQPLYQKVGRNLILTPAGLRVAAHAREERQRNQEFIQELREGSSNLPVTLCAGTGAYLYLLGQGIKDFTGQAIHGLQLVTGDRDRTVEMVASGRAHLGVTSLDATPDGISVEVLTEVEQILVMPPGHRLARRRNIRLEDLRDEALIVPPQGQPHRTMLGQMLMHAGVSWRVAVEAGGWELMLHFVGLGIGLAVVNGCCRVPEGLIARPLNELPRIRYHLLHRTGGLQNVGATALRECLVANSEAWRDTANASDR